MNKIGIVILNYLNYQDTIECVDSLLKQEGATYQAVLVDNLSPNESFDVLAKQYQDEAAIDVIQTNGNLGYAKGNNAGIVYLKEKYGIQNMLILNNDTIFTDPAYLAFLQQYPIGKDIGVLGTKIIGRDGKNQNPRYDSTGTKRLVKDVVYFTLDEYGIIKYYQKVKALLKNKKSPAASESVVEQKGEGEFFLHGSAVFLTENYLKLANGFYPDTFLYYEENILSIIMQKLGLKMVYDDTTEIYHKEDQSSAMSFNNVKSTFIKYLAQSIRIALKVKLMDIEKVLKRINTATYQRKESGSAQ